MNAGSPTASENAVEANGSRANGSNATPGPNGPALPIPAAEERPAAFAAVPRPPAREMPFVPADTRIGVAKAMLKGNHFADAERALGVLLQEKPDVAQAEMLLGVAIQKQKRYAEAKGHFMRVMAMRQSFPEIDHLFHFLGWCEYYTGDMESARRAFEEHLRRVPNEPDSTFGLALVAIEEDRTDDAEKLLRRAIEIQSKDPRAKRDLAKAHARLGDLYTRLDRAEDAENELREAVRLYPNHYEAWAKLARVLDGEGKSEQAERARHEEQAAMQRVGRARGEGAASPGESPGGETAPGDDGPAAPGDGAPSNEP